MDAFHREIKSAVNGNFSALLLSVFAAANATENDKQRNYWKKDVPTYITFKIENVYKTKMKLVYSKLLANTHEPVHRMLNRRETDKPR